MVTFLLSFSTGLIKNRIKKSNENIKIHILGDKMQYFVKTKTIQKDKHENTKHVP